MNFGVWYYVQVYPVPDPFEVCAALKYVIPKTPSDQVICRALVNTTFYLKFIT